MKKGYFTGDFEELRILSGLPGICAGVYYFLKNSRNMAKRDEITKMQTKIAEYYNANVRTVKRAIKSLKEAGLLTVTRKGRLNSYGFPMADGMRNGPEEEKAMDTKPEGTGTTEPEIQMTGEMTDNFSELPTIYIKEEEIMNNSGNLGTIEDLAAAREERNAWCRNAMANIARNGSPAPEAKPRPEEEPRTESGYSAATVRDYEIIMKDSFVRDRTWTNMRVFRSRPDSEKIEILKGCLSASTYFYDMHPSRKTEVMGYIIDRSEERFNRANNNRQ